MNMPRGYANCEAQEFYEDLLKSQSWVQYARKWREFYDCPSTHNRVRLTLYWERNETEPVTYEKRYYYNITCAACKKFGMDKLNDIS